eukprot:2723395-Heterocapsa_arctica.AAC.1
MELIHNKGRTTGAILERHLRNAMTAVVSETVASIMKDGVTPPEDGSWPPALIHSLMTAMGGQRMKDLLTAPAQTVCNDVQTHCRRRLRLPTLA